jgi:hypothetical protein
VNIITMKNLMSMGSWSNGQITDQGLEEALFLECLSLFSPVPAESMLPVWGDGNAASDADPPEDPKDSLELSLFCCIQNSSENASLLLLGESDSHPTGHGDLESHGRPFGTEPGFQRPDGDGSTLMPGEFFSGEVAFPDTMAATKVEWLTKQVPDAHSNPRFIEQNDLQLDQAGEPERQSFPHQREMEKWVLQQSAYEELEGIAKNSPAQWVRLDQAVMLRTFPQDLIGAFEDPQREITIGHEDSITDQNVPRFHLQNQQVVQVERIGLMSPERQVADAVQKELKLQWLSHHPDREIRIRLVPESLGEVTVSLQKVGNRIVGVMSASNEGTKDFLEQHQSWLKERLPDIQLRIVHSESHMHSQAGGRHFSQQQNHRKMGKTGRGNWQDFAVPAAGASNHMLDRHV